MLASSKPVGPALSRLTKAFRRPPDTAPGHAQGDFYKALALEQHERTRVVSRPRVISYITRKPSDDEPRPYRYSFVRVLFPDESYVQGTFHEEERVTAVRAWLSEDCLQYGGTVFTLSSAVVGEGWRWLGWEEEGMSLIDLGLTPAALMKFEGSELQTGRLEPKIKPHLFADVNEMYGWVVNYVSISGRNFTVGLLMLNIYLTASWLWYFFGGQGFAL